MTSAHFNFDEEIDRRTVPALKTHRLVLGEDGGDLFPAGVADMDFRAAPPIIDALRRRLQHGVFGYETVPTDLLPAIIAWFGTRYNWQIEAEHILRAPNVLNSLAIAASIFTEPGDGIIVQPPVFFDFYDIIAENNRQLLSNPLRLANGHYEMDFDRLAGIASDPRAKMLYLCNPHNPVGRVWRREELACLNAICHQNDVLVVSDEMHADLSFPAHAFTPFASLSETAANNCITCISPAKSFNIASCCSAFTIISDSIKRHAFQVENSRLTVNKNNAFSSVAMEAAYRDGAAWLDAVVEYIQDNVDLVRQRLDGLSGVSLIEPEGTFLLWFDCRGLALSQRELIAFFRNQAKWAVTDGSSFGDEGVGFVRANIACARSRLESALNQLETALIRHCKT